MPRHCQPFLFHSRFTSLYVNFLFLVSSPILMRFPNGLVRWLRQWMESMTVHRIYWFQGIIHMLLVLAKLDQKTSRYGLNFSVTRSTPIILFAISIAYILSSTDTRFCGIWVFFRYVRWQNPRSWHGSRSHMVTPVWSGSTGPNTSPQASPWLGEVGVFWLVQKFVSVVENGQFEIWSSKFSSNFSHFF